MLQQFVIVLKIVPYILILGALSFSYYKIHDLKNELNIVKENNVLLQSGISKQQSVIDNLQADFTNIQMLNDKLRRISASQQSKINKLKEKFTSRSNGTKRDFGDISRARPRLVERIINHATLNVNRCLEIVTGSPAKPEEKNDVCKNNSSIISK